MSLTYQGVIVAIIGAVFQFAGVPFVQADAQQAVSFIVQLLGALTALYGRYRVGGVTPLGLRK